MHSLSLHRGRIQRRTLASSRTRAFSPGVRGFKDIQSKECGDGGVGQHLSNLAVSSRTNGSRWNPRRVWLALMLVSANEWKVCTDTSAPRGTCARRVMLRDGREAEEGRGALVRW